MSNTSLAIGGNTALGIPSGNTAQRPTDTSAAYIRFNTDIGNYEGLNDDEWSILGGGNTNPSAPNLSIQVNVAGTLTGNANVLYDVANQNVSMEANIQLANQSPLYFGGNQLNIANAQFSVSYNTTATSLDFVFI